MKDPGRYVRRLSPMERYALVIHALHPYHVDAVVEGEGSIDPEQLRLAIAAAAAANPAIRVRLRGRLGYCRWVDSGIAPLLHVIDGVEWDARSEACAPYALASLDPARGGAVAEMILLRTPSGRCWLIGRAVHAALDGRGMLHWMRELFRALRGEALLGSDNRRTDLQVQMTHQQRVTDQPPAPQSCLAVLPAQTPAGELAYVWRRLEIPAQPAHMLARTAQFLAAYARQQGEGAVGFTIPVDFRALRDESMGLGNLTGYLRLNIAPDDTPRTLMRQLQQRLRAYADCRVIGGLRFVPWMPLAYMVRQLRAQLDQVLYASNPHLPSGGIVSMGQLAPDWFDAPGFRGRQAFAIPGAVGKLNVVFVQYPGFTTVTFAAPRAYNHEGQLDRMIAAFSEHFAGAELRAELESAS